MWGERETDLRFSIFRSFFKMNSTDSENPNFD